MHRIVLSSQSTYLVLLLPFRSLCGRALLQPLVAYYFLFLFHSCRPNHPAKMTEVPQASYTPLAAPLPPVPTEEVFTDLQWKTLLSLADTVIPSIRRPETATSRAQKVVSGEELDSAISTLTSSIEGPDAADLAARYLEEDVSSNPEFKEAIQRLFGRHVPTEARKGIALVLTALKYGYPLPLLHCHGSCSER